MENKIKITTFDDGLLIKFYGEVDSDKVQLYRYKIRDEMIKHGPRLLLFDFKDITFLDSSGIGLILGRYNEISKIRGICGLINLTTYTRKIVKISGLFQIMDEYKSLSDFKKKVGINLWQIKWNCVLQR